MKTARPPFIMRRWSKPANRTRSGTMNKQGRNIVYGFLNPLNEEKEETLMSIEIGPDMQKQFDTQIKNISDEFLNTWIEDYEESISDLEDGIEEMEQGSEDVEEGGVGVKIFYTPDHGSVVENLKEWNVELEETKQILSMLTREAQKRRSTAFKYFTGPHTTAGELKKNPEYSLISDQKEASFIVNVIYSEKDYWPLSGCAFLKTAGARITEIWAVDGVREGYFPNDDDFAYLVYRSGNPKGAPKEYANQPATVKFSSGDEILVQKEETGDMDYTIMNGQGS
jgi:hypothetical protein